MANANKLAKKTCYHGNAGIASAFAALAHKKLKPGGVLALGATTFCLRWFVLARLPQDACGPLHRADRVLAIAAADNDDLSFSSDTGMAECLVVARRFRADEPPDDVNRFISLSRRPQGLPTQVHWLRRALGGNPDQTHSGRTIWGYFSNDRGRVGGQNDHRAPRFK